MRDRGCWFARADTAGPAWYHADADPVIGRALRLMTNEPTVQWSVANLAADDVPGRVALSA